MEVRSVELAKNDFGAIEAIRVKRLKIAYVRMRGTLERYPEVAQPEVRPLTDAEIIRIALNRELAYQTQVEKDMAK